MATEREGRLKSVTEAANRASSLRAAASRARGVRVWAAAGRERRRKGRRKRMGLGLRRRCAA
jgi:hypothetical protein